METAQAAMDQHKRMTAGLHFAVGNTSLGPTLLAHMRETHRRQQIVRNQKEKKAKERFVAMEAKVQQLRGTRKVANNYTCVELKTLVLWFKREGDAPVPTTSLNLLTQYLDTYHRRDQTPPFPNMLIAEENDAVA